MSVTLPNGIYPASITPFDASGSIDAPSLLRLLAYFEAAGCQGAVLAGTNGEGPSLSSFEKRDLLRVARAGRGKLRLILGVSTPSLTEAHWLCSQAEKEDADAVLLMPPAYFRQAPLEGVEAWMSAVIKQSPIPVLVYNFPKMTGIELCPEFVSRLAALDNMIGIKDSSGNESNLTGYRAVLPPEKSLFVGDETLLTKALQQGWSGSISGAANTIPRQLANIVQLWTATHQSEALLSFERIVKTISLVRSLPQPAGNKAVLEGLGVITSGAPRLPLRSIDASELLAHLAQQFGTRPGELGLPG